MNEGTTTQPTSSIFFMLVSAALFGYFGFLTGMTATTAGGEFVLFFAILLWTLRVGAVAFAAAAILALFRPRLAAMIYGVAGLLTAAGLAVVGAMDWLDPVRASAIPPVLAFIFAVLNGLGSWSALREASGPPAGRGGR
jgi:hypothetical protein